MFAIKVPSSHFCVLYQCIFFYSDIPIITGRHIEVGRVLSAAVALWPRKWTPLWSQLKGWGFCSLPSYIKVDNILVKFVARRVCFSRVCSTLSSNQNYLLCWMKRVCR